MKNKNYNSSISIEWYQVESWFMWWIVINLKETYIIGFTTWIIICETFSNSHDFIYLCS